MKNNNDDDAPQYENIKIEFILICDFINQNALYFLFCVFVYVLLNSRKKLYQSIFFKDYIDKLHGTDEINSKIKNRKLYLDLVLQLVQYKLN